MSKDQNKARALSAMLENSTLTAAAEAAGISRRTLYSYVREDVDFGAAYRAARDQMVIEQMDRLNGAKDRATALLEHLMDDETQPSGIRLKAAQTIIAAAAKQAEAAQGATTAGYF